MTASKKCPHCGGKRGRHYIERASTDAFAAKKSWLPCQYCNLAAFGLDAEPQQSPDVFCEERKRG